MRNKLLLTLIIAVFFIPTISFSQDISDYLILQDRGPYKISKPEKLFPGEPPIGGPRTYDSHGIIGATGHFPDHADTTYEVMYLGATDELSSPTVQVTQHAGSESDKWLLHEVERGFRSDDLESKFEGTIKEIDGNKIFTWLLGTEYRWISNNIVVQIEYSDPELSKPEPLEVVKAYLAKHPSTITLTDTEIKSKAHNEKWVKDEMERRLWLGSKWIEQITTNDEDIYKKLTTTVKHLNVFLDYKKKYYGISVTEEKKAIYEYMQSKDEAAMKNKLTEYKSWWSANKDGAINL